MVKKGYILSESDRTLLSQTVAKVNGSPLTPSKLNRRHRDPAGGGMEYTGYFKVIDASETKDDGTKTLKVKVVDGADPTASLCGFALVNGYIREVAATTIEISDKSARAAYLYLNAVEETESDRITPKTPVFELVDQKIVNGTQINRALIATIKIANSTLSIVQQNFGVPNVFIWGSCQ